MPLRRGRWLCLALGLAFLTAARGKSKRKFVPALYPKITNKTFISQCLDAHNKLRSEVDPPASDMLYMTWDLALARIARAWARKCIFQHNQFSGHPDFRFNPPGENIWIGNAIRQPFEPIKPVHVWFSETIYYDYQKNLCKQICDHYTQIVWAATYKIGCAIVFCHKLGRHRNTENFVCNYGPRHQSRFKPYRKGQACSACSEEDTCHNKLCRNPERDHENTKRYSRWFPSWEHRIICDKSCIAVVILRPSLTFIAFIIVYCLQKHYPDLSLQT